MVNIDLNSGKPNSDYITEAFKNNFNFEYDEKNNSKDSNFNLKGFY